jgi:hypothetical protein
MGLVGMGMTRTVISSLLGKTGGEVVDEKRDQEAGSRGVIEIHDGEASDDRTGVLI